jgi:hypothetical protein
MSVHAHRKWPKVSDYLRLGDPAITSALHSCTATATSHVVQCAGYYL